jgi:hypothetical protein
MGQARRVWRILPEAALWQHRSSFKATCCCCWHSGLLSTFTQS